VGAYLSPSPRVRCPYHDARVWSRKAAPRRAWRRLGANDGQLECFVCVSVHDRRWLARLSDSEGAAGNDVSDDDGASGGPRRWTQPRRRRTWTLVPSLRVGPATALLVPARAPLHLLALLRA
jgi:hypothetical protein